MSQDSVLDQPKVGPAVNLNSSRLCNYCFEIMSKIPTQRRTDLNKIGFICQLDHYDTLSSLEESANHGCRLCAELVRSKRNSHNAIPPSGSLFLHQDYYSGNEHTLSSSIANSSSDAEISLPEIFKISGRIDQYVFHYTPAEADEYESYSHAKSVECLDENTEDVLPKCKTWLEDCAENHQCVSPLNQQTPTRLLHLTDSGVRLCLAEELLSPPKYATLSHCWGGLRFPMLKKSNIEDSRREIQLDFLPKTFQDAIRIARYLGITYLWVDSWCIVQDDAADWARESSKMTAIYGGSTVNIAASSSPDGTYGCFFDRSKSWADLIGFKTEEKHRWFDCTALNYSYYLATQPLAFRGWVLQEHVLPPRTLHFTEREIYWSCKQKFVSETCETQIPFWWRNGGFYQLATENLDSHKGWSNAVETYTRRRLTFPNDKLVAIAGLARDVQSTSEDVYVAGLWKEELKTQLCWRVVGEGKRMVPYVAPTWSWASVNAEVSVHHAYNEGQGATCIDIEGVNITHSTADPYGAISAATLRIKCRYLITAYFPKRFLGGETPTTLQLLSGSSTAIYAYPDIRDAVPGQYEKVYLLPIFFDLAHKFPYIQGLMLDSTKRAPGQYERVGYFYQWDMGIPLGLQDPEKPDLQIGEDECVEITTEADGTQRFVVEIV